MASIAIHDLRPAGADLFADSENFMTDLVVDYELNTVNGGFTPLSFVAVWGVQIATGYLVSAFSAGVASGIYVTTR